MGLSSSDTEDFGDFDENDLLLAASQTETLISSQHSPLKELSNNRTWTPPSSQPRTVPEPKLITRAPSKPPSPQKSQHPTQAQLLVALPQVSGPYRFTFGKYKGRKVDEVPQCYVSFLRDKRILKEIPDLNAAVESMEWEEEARKTALQSPMVSSLSQPAAPEPAPVTVALPAPPTFRFPFGMHKNKTLSEVPADYILYVKAQGLVDELPGLAAALQTWENLSTPKMKNSLPSSNALPPATSAPPGSFPPPRSQISELAPPNTLKYRFNFGLHMGKSLMEVPHDYLTFLNDRGIIDTRPDLLSAIIDYKHQNPSLLAPPDPSQYVLNFGVHTGMRLDAVPPSYIQFLKDENIGLDRPDLEVALKCFEKKNMKVQKEKVKKGGISSKPAGRFKVPSDVTADRHRFFRDGEQMWIAASDAKIFFGAETQALSAAGVTGMGGTKGKKPRRFWLHQVFYFAKHFGTTGLDTPTKALNKFKARNHEVGGGSSYRSSFGRSNRWCS